jgi:hypothetical protein
MTNQVQTPPGVATCAPGVSPCTGCARAERYGSCPGGEGASPNLKAGCRPGELFHVIGDPTAFAARSSAAA